MVTPTLDRLAGVAFWGLVSAHVAAFLSLLCDTCGFWTMFLSMWAALTGVYWTKETLQVPVEEKAVLVTGCDSGFGLALAHHLHDMGFTVIAGCLFSEKGEGALQLREKGSERLHVLQMDVTCPKQLQAARLDVDKILANGELWGLVNNAGIAAFGEVEWVPQDTFKKVMEVNYFGTINACKTFLPLVRRAKGRVVNVASMLGRMGTPLRAPYVASKYAVEGFTDCLRHEMKPWGVSVVLMEPGNYVAGTAIFTDEGVQKQAEDMWAGMTEEVQGDYGRDHFDDKVTLMKGYINAGDKDVTAVIDDFTSALLQRYPQARYQTTDLYYKTRIFVSTHLPEWIYDNIYISHTRS